MTTKKIKSSDILGDNYYTYDLTSSNYTPNLNSSITITCTVKNIYGDTITNKSVQLYQNDVAVGNAKTTNNNGVVTWTITCSTAGVQKFSIKDNIIEVFVDTTSKTGHNHTTSDITNFPDIPTKTSDLTNDSGYLTTHQDISGKENITNKSSSIISDTGSTTKYPTVKAVEDYAVQKTTPKNISELTTLLENASNGDTITLTDDYIITDYFNYISSKDIIINGNGHTIDANNNPMYFNFTSQKTLKIINCYFKNLYSHNCTTGLIATPISSSTIIFDNCIFDKGSAKQALICIKDGYLKMNNCLFKDILLNLEGQIISISNSDCEIYNTYFEGNTITPIYIKNKSLKNNIIKNCVFNNNIVAVLNESAESYQNTILENNLFLQSGDTLTGCVNKNYLTTHQDISGKANISDLATVATSGSYNDLSNKPTIPTKTSDLTNDNNFLSQHQDITGKEDKSNKISSWSETSSNDKYPSEKLVKDELDNKANNSDIPTNNNQLVNGAGYITSSTLVSHNTSNAAHSDIRNTLNDKANSSDVPTKTSDLTNDSDFISTSSTNGLIKNDGSIDTNTYLTTSNASSTYLSKTDASNTYQPKGNYLTSHQDISGKANVNDLGSVAFSNDYDDLDNKPSIPAAYTHPLTHSSSMITDSNTYSNIGNTASTLDNILSNIDTKIGSLGSVELIEVTTNKGTASASTMNKLYLVAESSSATNDNYEIFVTVRTGTSGNYSYAWEKVDTARIDLSNYLTTTNAQQTYVAKETGKGLSSNDYTTTEKNKLAGLHTVATSGSYNDLTNKPNIPTHTSDLTNDSGYLTEHQDISGKANISDLGDTAFSNNYNDLYNKPTIPTVPTNVSVFTNDSGYLTSHQDISGKANISDLGSVAFSNDYTDLDNKPSQNVFYGTCSTSASTQTKVITCTNWSFDEGNILFVFFSNGNTYDGTTKISIKNTLKNLYSVGTNLDSRYYWKSGEVVGFIYDGNQFIMLEGGTATTTYYGITKLSDSISSTSTSLSATANAVRKAYNLANGKADEIHTHTISDVTSLQNSLNNKLEENDLLNLVYPVGSIYMSVVATDPDILFGGTWEQIEDMFLLSSGTTYTPTYDNNGFANNTGGEASVTLTANQSGIKSHTHTISHTHNVGDDRELVSHVTGKGIGEKRVSVPSSGTTYAPVIVSDDNWYGHTATGGASTNNSGGTTDTNASQAHNNMPPYLVVNVWKRIA